jgi:hypothetical protein
VSDHEISAVNQDGSGGSVEQFVDGVVAAVSVGELGEICPE